MKNTTYGDLIDAIRQEGKRQGFIAGVGAVVTMIERLASAEFLGGEDSNARELRDLAGLAKDIPCPVERPPAELLDGAWKHLRPDLPGVKVAVYEDPWDTEIVEPPAEQPAGVGAEGA